MGCLDILIDPVFYVPTLCGVIVWGALFYFGRNFSPFEDIQKTIEFGSNFISIPHAFLSATMSLIFIIYPHELMFVCFAPFVCSNMLADVLFYCIPNQEFGFAVHHLIVVFYTGLVYSAGEFAYVYGAYLALIEYSTSVLTIAYFARVFDWRKIYYLTGIAKLTVYPGLRLIWIPIYWALFALDEDVKHYNKECAIFMPFIYVCTATIFCMSFYWFCFLIAPNPRRHLYLFAKDTDEEETGGGSAVDTQKSNIITMVPNQDSADL